MSVDKWPPLARSLSCNMGTCKEYEQSDEVRGECVYHWDTGTEEGQAKEDMFLSGHSTMRQL